MRLQLETRQAGLLDAIVRVEALLSAAEPPPVALSGELRVAVGDMLADEFRFKEEALGRLRRLGIVAVDRQVVRCRSAMVAVQVAYRFHCLDWTEEAIAGDWAGYAASARKIITRMRTLVALDRAQLYPLLDQLLAGQKQEEREAAAARALLLSLAAPVRAF